MPLEYTLLGVGIALMTIEFIIPGFGIFGISGIIAIAAGIYYFLGGGLDAMYMLLVVAIVITIVCILVFKYLPIKMKWNPFVLLERQENRHGYVSSDNEEKYLGKTGEVVTPLRPAGTILVDNVRIDVVTFGDYITTGLKVKVVKVEGNKLFVRKVED